MSKRLKHVFRCIAGYLAIGLIITLVIATMCAVFVDFSAVPSASYSHGEWTVTVQSPPGAMRVTCRREVVPWGPMQATGPPDTVASGDFATAWAPASQSGAPEWLLLTYHKPIRIRFVDVCETYHPGALRQISLITDSGEEIPAWSGDDPTPPSAFKGVSHIPIHVKGRETPMVQKVKLYQGKPSVPGWNEIDAVGATDDKGQIHWAEIAEASSFYGQPLAGSAQSSPLKNLPSWFGLDPVGFASSTSELYGADARGWPMVALWGPMSDAALAASPSSNRAVTLGTFSELTTTGSLAITSSSGTVLPMTSLPAPRPSTTLPWRPVWSGLIIDSLLFAAAIWILRALLTRPRRFLVEVSRMKRGCCVRCGYELNYDFVNGCSECGWRRQLNL